MVLRCLEKGIGLDELPLDEFRQISPVFDSDIYEAVSMKACVEKRLTVGAPGQEAMIQAIESYKKRLEEE